MENAVLRTFIMRRTGVPASSCNSNNSSNMPPPPDAVCLLCHKHQLALLPPHLEAYLYGESPKLIDPPAVATTVAVVAASNGDGVHVASIPAALSEAGIESNNKNNINNIIPSPFACAGLDDVEASHAYYKSLLLTFQGATVKRKGKEHTAAAFRQDLRVQEAAKNKKNNEN
jgi:hypothetical protein